MSKVHNPKMSAKLPLACSSFYFCR